MCAPVCLSWVILIEVRSGRGNIILRHCTNTEEHMEEKEEVKNSMPFWKRPTMEAVKRLDFPREGV